MLLPTRKKESKMKISAMSEAARWRTRNILKIKSK